MELLKQIKIIVTGFFLLALISCSSSVPEIGQIVWQVNFLQKAVHSSVRQNLSFFILIEDEDGITDIDYIYLIHDESELFWKLDPSNWTQKILSGKSWIGSNTIIMNDRSGLPHGKYRVMVIDKAGERDSREIYLSTKQLDFDSKKIFPELIIGTDIIINSLYSENTLWIYDETMEILKNLKIESGKISRSIINNDTSGKAYWISINSTNEENGTGLIKGPYLLNP
jgi:hypothetical protein